MPAAGHTKIIGDQPTGNQPLYPKLSQKTFLLLYLFTTETPKFDAIPPMGSGILAFTFPQ
jgi:hypothetical protein